MHLCIFLNLEIKFIGVLLTNGILFKTITCHITPCVILVDCY